MPIYVLECPDCGHCFTGMVFAGTRLPETWVCPDCGRDAAHIRPDCAPVPHPLEGASHGAGCPCCRGATDTR